MSEQRDLESSAFDGQSQAAEATERPGLEISRSDGQRHQRVMALMAERGEVLRRQGFVAETWRWRNGRRVGPFYDLRYREEGRLRSVYLGRSSELAEEVRARLRAMQAPRRERREAEEFWTRQQAQLRELKARWAVELEKAGLRLKGYEVRGWGKLEAEEVGRRQEAGAVGSRQ